MNTFVFVLKFIRFNMALFLVLTFSAGLGYQTFTVTWFYWNRAEITEKYCINKDKPQMNCHGKCHLEKQLTAPAKTGSADADNVPEPLSFWLYGVELMKDLRIFYLMENQIHQTAYLSGETTGVFNVQFVPPDYTVIVPGINPA